MRRGLVGRPPLVLAVRRAEPVGLSGPEADLALVRRCQQPAQTGEDMSHSSTLSVPRAGSPDRPAGVSWRRGDRHDLRRPRTVGGRPPGTKRSGAGRGWSSRAGGPGSHHGRGSPRRPPRPRGRPRPAPSPAGPSRTLDSTLSRGWSRRSPSTRPWTTSSVVLCCRLLVPVPGRGRTRRPPTAAASGAVPRGQDDQRRVVLARRGRRRSPQGTCGGLGVVHPGDDGHLRPRRHDVALADDGHRAVRVRADRPRHRPQEQPGQRAPAAVADDEQLGHREASTSADAGPSKTGEALTSSPGARDRARSAPSSAIFVASATRAAAGGAGALPTASAG